MWDIYAVMHLFPDFKNLAGLGYDLNRKVGGRYG